MFNPSVPQPNERPMLNRRHLLLAAGSAALAGAAHAAPGDGAKLRALMDGAMQEALLDSPQLMTLLGMDAGPYAAAKGKLDDRSTAGVLRMKTLMQKMRD